MKTKFPPCPKCKKKGLRYADHLHAYGWKDYSKATCRYCHSTFTIKQKVEIKPEELLDSYLKRM